MNACGPLAVGKFGPEAMGCLYDSETDMTIVKGPFDTDYEYREGEDLCDRYYEYYDDAVERKGQ